MNSRQRLFLIDAMAIAYRAYYAFFQRPLVNSKGQNTSAVYGFVTFLNKILTQEDPEYIAVVFDTAAPTFRHKAYNDYKATRQKMPEDMIPQLGLLKDVVKAYNIPLLELAGFEADDIMGTLALRAQREGIETFLVTGDKDFMQLVSDKVRIYRPGKQGDESEIIGLEEVEKKFGVTPDKVVDVLGLVGDSSDNVPGVPGVGEKTAIPLVQSYGTMEGIYDNIQSIPQKGLRAKLEANKDKAFLSKSLVTIDTNVPIDVDIHSLKASEKNAERLLELFEVLEFRALAQKLKYSAIEDGLKTLKTSEQIRDSDLASIQTDKHTYHMLGSAEEFQRLCAYLSNSKQFAFSLQSDRNDRHGPTIGISLCTEAQEAFYVPLRDWYSEKNDELFTQQEEKGSRNRRGVAFDAVFRELRPLLENEGIQKIGHDLKSHLSVLSRLGMTLEGPVFDTMIASYVLRADGEHSLEAAAKEYLGYKTITYEELTGSGKDQRSLREIDLQTLSDLACEDADITFRLFRVFKERLHENNMDQLCEEVEFPLLSVLGRMERKGVCVDVAFLEEMSKDLDRQIDNLKREVYGIAGNPFNINSPQQLGDVLFNKLHLPTVRKTKTGFSTDVTVLESLRHEHPVIEKLLDYRQLSKLQSTYVEALPGLINPRTGRVHTSFNQTVAATGRLSSSDPNLQNIPIRTEIGRSIRKAFIPGDETSLIMSADYSQVELRVMAHISGDEGLAEAFRNREDVHITTAAKVFGVPPNEVTREMRRKAKEVNFGIMYGIGAFGLSNRLEISQPEGKEIIERYFERFPKVKQYINDTIEEARKVGYVKTLLGRRRYLPDLRSANRTVRQNAERQAINMPIQGTAADMIKVAMVRIDDEFRKLSLGSAMLLQVHDELVFEVKKSEDQKAREVVLRNMRDALTLNVPVEVEIGVGKNWLEAH